MIRDWLLGLAAIVAVIAMVAVAILTVRFNDALGEIDAQGEKIAGLQDEMDRLTDPAGGPR